MLVRSGMLTRTITATRPVLQRLSHNYEGQLLNDAIVYLERIIFVHTHKDIKIQDQALGGP